MSQETDNLMLQATGLPINVERYSNALVSGTSTNVISSSAGFLHAITVIQPSCATITFYNHASGPSGAIIATFGANTPVGSYLINSAYTTGLVVQIPIGGVTPQIIVNKR